ncbi:MAG TPA: alpha/beta hydrolase [Candidatus Nanopelagicales bacterium]
MPSDDPTTADKVASEVGDGDARRPEASDVDGVRSGDPHDDLPGEVLHTARGDFAAIVAGPSEGPVVLLLHGFPELNLSWRHQVPALAAAGYRVVAPNQRGYAGSVRDGSYATVDLAADAVAMLDAVGAERAVVVGHDWGGGVAWTIAQAFPERVAALAVLNCPPPSVLRDSYLRNPRQLARSWYVFFFQLPVLPERFVAGRVPRMLVGGSYNRGAWNRALLTPYSDAFASADDVHGPINWYRGAFRSMRNLAGRGAQRITAPVLIIWGVHDMFLGHELVSSASLRPVLSYANEPDLVLIEEAGHFVQNEAPDEVNRALLEWLAEHEGDIRPL